MFVYLLRIKCYSLKIYRHDKTQGEKLIRNSFLSLIPRANKSALFSREASLCLFSIQGKSHDNENQQIIQLNSSKHAFNTLQKHAPQKIDISHQSFMNLLSQHPHLFQRLCRGKLSRNQFSYFVKKTHTRLAL